MTPMPTTSPDNELTLLLVEDDDIDAEVVRRSLRQAKIINPLVRANDGLEALDMLRGTNGYTRIPEPYLLLVDVKMPRLDGIGLIREIRADPELTRTVIFVLTTSDDDRDKVAAYDLHVAGYVVKTNTKQEVLPLMMMLDYYLLIVDPPPSARLESPGV
jgi:CheY-like chemotaxis protein